MPDPIKAVEEIARATANVAAQVTQRDGEKNTPPIQAAAAAAKEQKQIDQIAKHVAEANIQEIRNDDAE